MLRKISLVLGRARSGLMRRVYLLAPGGNPRNMISPVKYWKALDANQVGAITGEAVASFFVVVVLIVVLIIFVWQQGGPMMIEATSNTTALTDAGATAQQVSWFTWAGGALLIILVIAVFIWGVRSLLNPGSGAGMSRGGGRRRRR